MRSERQFQEQPHVQMGEKGPRQYQPHPPHCQQHPSSSPGEADDTHLQSASPQHQYDPEQREEVPLHAFQHLMPRPVDKSFTPEMWWIVDRQYRPKLSQGATPIVVRCMRIYGWSEKYARRVLLGYRQFLSLKKTTKDWDGRILEPSKEIHRLWQQHILDVVNYTYDCILICGKMLSHRPDDEELVEERRQRRWNTKQALEQYFSDIDTEVWHEIVTTGPVNLNEWIEEDENEVTILAEEPEDETYEKQSRTSPRKQRPVQSREIPGEETPRSKSNSLPQKVSTMTRQERRERFLRRGLPSSPMRLRPVSPSKSRKTTQTAPKSNSPKSAAALSSKYDRLEASYRSPPRRNRASTPVAERPYDDQIPSRAHTPNPPPPLLQSIPDRESRVDLPAPRIVEKEDKQRLGYEIETDWGVVKSWEVMPEEHEAERYAEQHEENDEEEEDEVVEDEQEISDDPICSRRMSYEVSEYESVAPPFRPVSPSREETYHDVATTSAKANNHRKTMTLHIRDSQCSFVLPTRVRKTTKLGRMFHAYAVSQNLPLAYLHFFWRGRPVRSADTPLSLGLRDHDKIEVWNSLRAGVAMTSQE